MPSLSPSAVDEVVKNSHLLRVTNLYGDDGQFALQRLTNLIRLFFRRHLPEDITSDLHVFVPIRTSPNLPKSLSDLRDKAVSLTSLDTLPLDDGNTVFLVALDDDTWVKFDDVPSEDIIKECLQYAFIQRRDVLILQGEKILVQNVAWPRVLSVFSTPTFSDLQSALDHFRQQAEHSQLFALDLVWEGKSNGPRLVLVNKPERLMRKAMKDFLQASLIGANVKEEQNTNESRPIDITIDWDTSAKAGIEIKWLGQSTKGPRKDGQPRDPSDLLNYTDRRAQDGANQLAQYIQNTLSHDSAVNHRFYHVVFDGRRKGCRSTSSRLSKEDAFYYRDSEVAYNDDWISRVRQYAGNIRYYLHPGVAHLVEVTVK